MPDSMCAPQRLRTFKPVASNVVVVDYGVGNLLSVARAFEHIGSEVAVTSEHTTIAAADRIVLPGVGAFGHAMQALSDRDLTDAVRQPAIAGRPFLGICLGMQMILEQSSEFGSQTGLGLIKGSVEKISERRDNGKPRTIPHVGWNRIKPLETQWENTLLDRTSPGEAFYFVHSYHGLPSDDKDLTALCDYDDITVTAVIGRENVWGVQFHPEKSGSAGLNLLRRFMAL